MKVGRVTQIEAFHYLTGLRQRIVALITSNLKRTGATQVTIQKNTTAGQQMGLQTDSVVVADNLVTVLDREVGKVIGTCPVMDDVDTALRRALKL